MQTAKQSARELIEHLPESTSWDDLMHALYVRQKLDRSQAAANSGRVTSHSDARRRLLGNAD